MTFVVYNVFGRAALLSEKFWPVQHQNRKNVQFMKYLRRPSLPPQSGSITPDGVTNHRLGTTVLLFLSLPFFY